MIDTTILEKPPEQAERWMWWHWQNLNDKKDGAQGSGLRHGRCWWHFRAKAERPGNTIMFSWNLWASFCGIGFDIDDEDLTFSIAFPPVAFWLSFSIGWWLVDKLAPRKVLSEYYPDTIVVDDRECSIRVHSGSVWIKPWGTQDWHRDDPWWKRGINFSINPFEWRHLSHEVRCFDKSKQDPSYYYWVPFVGLWEHDKQPDGRETFTYPYRYELKNGTIQERIAEVYVERMTWRPKCLWWTSLFDKVRTNIDVHFNDEVGERSGSWKGGCLGCGYEMLPSEYCDPELTLRRMERERKF